MKTLGRQFAVLMQRVGDVTLFSLSILRTGFEGPFPWRSFIDQMYLSGVRSVPITIVAAGFVGGIMAIQINLELRDFGAQGFLGGLSTSTTLRDIGPTLIAFLLSGKVGAFTSAELGTMKVTDQVDAIRCLGVDPKRFLLLPRLLAVICSSFILLVMGLVVTIFGGMAIASFHLGVNTQNYFTNIPRLLSFWSVLLGGSKSLIFGVIIASVCCYYGYHTEGGAEGVGRSVRKTAVVTMVCIIVANFTVSSLFSLVHSLLGMELI